MNFPVAKGAGQVRNPFIGMLPATSAKNIRSAAKFRPVILSARPTCPHTDIAHRQQSSKNISPSNLPITPTNISPRDIFLGWGNICENTVHKTDLNSGNFTP